MAAAILSWLIAFNVVNIRNDFVRSDLELAFGADRAVAPANPQCPAQSGRIDISPIILLLGVMLLEGSSFNYLYPYRRSEAPDGGRPSQTKANTGRFFEDFRVGRNARHATPHTLHDRRRRALFGDIRRALCGAIGRYFRPPIGYPKSPVDDFLAFHIVFGKTVADVSLNAIANLGYADCRFLKAGLSRRHALGVLANHRSEGKLQPAERRRHRRARKASISTARSCSTMCAG